MKKALFFSIFILLIIIVGYSHNKKLNDLFFYTAIKTKVSQKSISCMDSNLKLFKYKLNTNNFKSQVLLASATAATKKYFISRQTHPKPFMYSSVRLIEHAFLKYKVNNKNILYQMYSYICKGQKYEFCEIDRICK